MRSGFTFPTFLDLFMWECDTLGGIIVCIRHKGFAAPTSLCPCLHYAACFVVCNRNSYSSEFVDAFALFGSPFVLIIN